VNAVDWIAKREKMLDEMIAASFPASDPPSYSPDRNEDSFSSESESAFDQAAKPPGLKKPVPANQSRSKKLF